MILSRNIIVGIAYTAPFSPWSNGAYLAAVLPLLFVTMLFFITYMYSNQEKQVKQLTFATSVDPYRYGLVKCSAMTAGFLLISLFVIIISIAFYIMLFRFYNLGDFFIPIVITLLPCLFFILGLGLLAGSVQANILYVLMLAALLLNFLPLPEFFDLYGGTFFASYPLALPAGLDGEPAFTLPISFILGKVFFSAAGILMTALGLKRYAKTMN
jgi:hypothetical protein